MGILEYYRYSKLGILEYLWQLNLGILEFLLNFAPKTYLYYVRNKDITGTASSPKRVKQCTCPYDPLCHPLSPCFEGYAR